METLLANHEERTVKGLLMPWGEKSRASNIGPIMFTRDTLAIPTDPAIVTANVRHKREDPVGRAVALEDSDAGLVATFSIAKTAEGDQLLADIKDNKLTRLSAEVKGVMRDAVDKTKAVAGALFGAAFVDEGAFASATLYAELADVEAHSKTEEEYTDDNGVTWRRVYESDTSSEDTDNGTKTTTVTTVTEETSEAAAEDTTEEETMAAEAATTPAATTPAAATAATVPQTLMAGTAAPGDQNTVHQVAHAMAAFARTNDPAHIEALAEKSREAGDLLFAALTDIKATSTGAAGLAIIQPQWIGDVWKERTYVRKFAPLLGEAPLTSYKVKGFEFTTKAEGGDWAGNKANVPSGAVATEEVSVTADRWAGGHDIAREFRDFDVPEFWTAYFAQMANSYARWSDAKALAAAVAGATEVTAGEVPAGVNAATTLVVDGALAVIATEEATPSFAVAATDVYRSLLLQTKDDLLATLTLGMGLESGDLAGFRIVPSSTIAAGKVLVGAKEAATFYELPGAPIRTEALDMVKGGIDTGFFGYAATVINNSAALALTSPAAAE